MSHVAWPSRAGWLLALLLALAPGIAAGEAPPIPGDALPGQRRSLSVLRAALASHDYATRLIAVEAVAIFPGSEEWLAYALGDPEHDVRLAAVESLRALHSERAVQLLRTVRDDGTEALDIRALAASALLALHHKE